MKQCIKIIVSGSVHSISYKEFIQKHALDLRIEGCMQTHEEETLLIFACGQADSLDELIDYIYKGTTESRVKDVIIEPFINEKTFRGIFRIIGE